MEGDTKQVIWRMNGSNSPAPAIATANGRRVCSTFCAPGRSEGPSGPGSDELEAIEIESTHVIEIDCFVPRQQIDQRFFHTPYYAPPTSRWPRRRSR